MVMVDGFLRHSDSMRIALALLLTAAPVTAAAAQSDSVTVNSMGVVGGDGQVLIDPGTGQPRALPPLMQPWQFQQEPIKLHPPRRHIAKKTPAEDYSAAPEAAETPKPKKQHAAVAGTEPQAPVEAPKPKKIRAATVTAPEPTTPVEAPKAARTAKVEPPKATPKAAEPQSSGAYDRFSDLQTLSVGPAKPEPKKPAPAVAKPPPVVAKPAPVEAKPTPPPAPAPVAAPPPKPVKQASIEPAKPLLPRAIPGTKRDSITFAPNASDPSSSAVSDVRTLAGSLNDALNDGSARVQLMAYAGQKGEKTSDTRRLSLKRALVVRQLLIDDGIPSERIDVFALGGVEDSGPLDRVDVLLKR